MSKAVLSLLVFFVSTILFPPFSFYWKKLLAVPVDDLVRTVDDTSVLLEILSLLEIAAAAVDGIQCNYGAPLGPRTKPSGKHSVE